MVSPLLRTTYDLLLAIHYVLLVAITTTMYRLPPLPPTPFVGSADQLTIWWGPLLGSP